MREQERKREAKDLEKMIVRANKIQNKLNASSKIEETKEHPEMPAETSDI